LSDIATDKKGDEIWAGLGWTQSKDKNGVFMEHSGNSKEEVMDLLEKSLNSIKNYRKSKFGDNNHKVCGVKCKDKPVAVVVCAIYKIEPW